MQGSLHTVGNFRVPYNEGNFCNNFGTVPHVQIRSDQIRRSVVIKGMNAEWRVGGGTV